jgi:predicted NBD/HSP70 family sugar kinase
LDTPDARSVVRLAQSGDVLAGQAIRQAGHRLGEVLAAAVNLLNPSLITLWGYLADAEDQLTAGIREGIARNAHAGPAGAVRIEPATLGADAGLYGAAMTVVEHALQPDSVDSYLLTNR